MNENKLVFFVQRWSSGGMEGVITEIIRNFPKTNINIEIVTIQKENSVYENVLSNLNINIIALNKNYIKNPFIRNVIAFKKYRDYLKKNKGIILHINIYNAISNIFVKLIPKNFVKQIIVHAHNNGFDNDKLKIKNILNEISKKIFYSKDTIKIACSKNAAKFCFGIDDVIIIKNAIDLEKFYYDERIKIKKINEIGLEKKFIVGNIGRLVPQKNQLRLINIFNEIKKVKEEAVLVIIGDGPEEEKIYAEINNKSLKDSFILLKNRNDINELLNMMDCFVFPSVYEGFGIVALEAQATGLPTFISKELPEEIFATKQAIRINLEESDMNIASIICEYDYHNRKSNKLKEFSIKEMANNIYALYKLK